MSRTPLLTQDEALRDACRERCADFGEPPCWKMDQRSGETHPACSECLRDIGIEPGDEFDENAAVGRLL